MLFWLYVVHSSLYEAQIRTHPQFPNIVIHKLKPHAQVHSSHETGFNVGQHIYTDAHTRTHTHRCIYLLIENGLFIFSKKKKKMKKNLLDSQSEAFTLKATPKAPTYILVFYTHACYAHFNIAIRIAAVVIAAAATDVSAAWTGSTDDVVELYGNRITKFAVVRSFKLMRVYDSEQRDTHTCTLGQMCLWYSTIISNRLKQMMNERQQNFIEGMHALLSVYISFLFCLCRNFLFIIIFFLYCGNVHTKHFREWRKNVGNKQYAHHLSAHLHNFISQRC